MNASTLRPLLIILLFGFLPTSGWMIVRDGAGHSVTRVITDSCPMPGAGAGAHRHAAGPWPASPATSHPGAVYAQPSARIAPHASHGPTSQTDPSAPELAANGYPDDGFGIFRVPATLPGPLQGVAPAAALAGALDNGFPGDPADPTVGLLDAPGGLGTTRTNTAGSGTGGTSPTGNGGAPPGTGTGGTSPGGRTPAGSNGNHQLTAPEPSTLALFLAGAAALGFALRRRRLGS